MNAVAWPRPPIWWNWDREVVFRQSCSRTALVKSVLFLTRLWTSMTQRNNLFMYAWKNEWWVPTKKLTPLQSRHLARPLSGLSRDDHHVIMYLNGLPQTRCLRANWVFNPDSSLWIYDPSILSIRHVGLIPSGFLEPNSIRKLTLWSVEVIMMRKCWIELEKSRKWNLKRSCGWRTKHS